MKEEFDHYIKNQIESLNKVPNLEFDEEKVWNKVSLGTVSGSGSGLLPFIGLSLIIVIGIFYYTMKKQSTPKKDTNTIIAIEKPDTLSVKETVIDSTAFIQKEPFVSKKDTIIVINETLDTIKKEVSYPPKINIVSTEQKKKVSTPSNKNNLETKKTNSVQNPVVGNDTKDSTKTDIPYAQKINTGETEKQNRKTAPFKNNISKAKSTSLVKTASSDQKQKEIVLSTTNYSIALGLNYLNPITESSSIAFGAHFRKFYSLSNNSDWNNYSNNLNFEFPLQFRYHLNFPESKFSAFLYGSAINSFNLNQTEKNSPYGLRFESGAELRYLIFKNKNNKKAYLFFRLPFYNTTLINNNTSPSSFNFGKQ